jgi:UDP-GlcNAc3NAcA epimerase
MYDNSLHFSSLAARRSDILTKLQLENKSFSLVTMHRPSNVDDPAVLAQLFSTFHNLAEEEDTMLVIPLHPRTMKLYETQIDRAVFDKVRKSSRLRIIPAVSFLEMILLEKSAEIIMTDSGGVQKEAYYFHRPCVIMLEETPWVELIESGTALLAGSDGKKIRDAYQKLRKQSAGLQYPPIFGDGKAAGFICEKIIENFG